MCEGRVLEQNMHILNIGVQFVHLLQSKKLVMSSKCGGVVGPRILGTACRLSSSPCSVKSFYAITDFSLALYPIYWPERIFVK